MVNLVEPRLSDEMKNLMDAPFLQKHKKLRRHFLVWVLLKHHGQMVSTPFFFFSEELGCGGSGSSGDVF